MTEKKTTETNSPEEQETQASGAADQENMDGADNQTDETVETAAEANQETDEAKSIAKLQLENNELNQKVLRTLAEFENFRRRNRTENDQKVKYAIQPICTALLNGIDNLERAMEAADKDSGEGTQNLLKGLQMVHAQFLDIFEQHGVKKIDPLHEPFDPNFHEAMGTVASDELDPNTVAEVLRSGYCLHERVIRPAMVHISVKASE